ncbi:MAG: YtxH domain-containing protein [Terriglobales bacterium]
MTDYEEIGEYRQACNHSALALMFLAIGVAAGALLGLLLAPKSGKQMRRNLRRRYEDARDRIEDWGDQAGDLLERGSGYASLVKEKVAPIKKAIRKQSW